MRVRRLGAAPACQAGSGGIVPRRPLKTQVKRYGSALGFHPRGKGSTPFTRTDARVVQQPRRSARTRQTQMQFLPRALFASQALAGERRTCNADQVGSTPARSSMNASLAPMQSESLLTIGFLVQVQGDAPFQGRQTVSRPVVTRLIRGASPLPGADAAPCYRRRMKFRPRIVLLAIVAFALPLGAAYGWRLRCPCPSCSCGWGCHCQKYWTPIEMAGIALFVLVVGVIIFRVLRRTRLSGAAHT